MVVILNELCSGDCSILFISLHQRSITIYASHVKFYYQTSRFIDRLVSCTNYVLLGTTLLFVYSCETTVLGDNLISNHLCRFVCSNRTINERLSALYTPLYWTTNSESTFSVVPLFYSLSVIGLHWVPLWLCSSFSY